MAETHLTDNKPIRIAAVYVMLFRYRLPNEFGPIRGKKKKNENGWHGRGGWRGKEADLIAFCCRAFRRCAQNRDDGKRWNWCQKAMSFTDLENIFFCWLLTILFMPSNSSISKWWKQCLPDERMIRSTAVYFCYDFFFLSDGNGSRCWWSAISSWR